MSNVITLADRRAIRDAVADTPTVDTVDELVGDKSPDWWAGYRQACREIRAHGDASYVEGALAALEKVAPQPAPVPRRRSRR